MPWRHHCGELLPFVVNATIGVITAMLDNDENL
jgi:hypothetical protein